MRRTKTRITQNRSSFISKKISKKIKLYFFFTIFLQVDLIPSLFFSCCSAHSTGTEGFDFEFHAHIDGVTMMKQKLLSLAIQADDYGLVLDLLEENSSGEQNDFYDEAFIKSRLVPLLSHQNCRVRGLASWVLFQIGKDLPLSETVFAVWKEAINRKDLRYVFTGKSNYCDARVKVLGNHGNRAKANSIGVAVVESEPGTTSLVVCRNKMDEEYFIVAGVGVVWIKQDCDRQEIVIPVRQGSFFSVPRKAGFQFKTLSQEPLLLLRITHPPYGVVAQRERSVETVLPNSFWTASYVLQGAQRALFNAVINKNYNPVACLLEKSKDLFRQREFVDVLLRCFWHNDRIVRFLAFHVVDELLQEKKATALSEYVSVVRGWGLDDLEKDFDRSSFLAGALDGAKNCVFGVVMNDKSASAVYTLMAHENLSFAAKHKTYNEKWSVISGLGELILRDPDGVCTTYSMHKGMSVFIPAQTAFQFRNTDKNRPIKIFTLTNPPWSGEGDVEFVVPMYEDSLYTDPQKLAQDFQDRNLLRDLLLHNYGFIDAAIEQLKKEWGMREDLEIFKRIAYNKQNALEHPFEVIRFYRSLQALSDAVPIESLLSLNLDKEIAAVLEKAFQDDEIRTNVHSLVAFCMKELGFADVVLLYERWSLKIEAALEEEDIDFDGYSFMVATLIQKMLDCQGFDATLRKALHQNHLAALSCNPYWGLS